MRILVVDDNPAHLAAAKEQLGKEHEPTLLDSYEPALELLSRSTDLSPPPFDALLCDLLMPAEPMTLGPEGMQYLGHEMPIGLVLAIRAATAGVQLVAVITDANHHNHPMSAAVDWLGVPLLTKDGVIWVQHAKIQNGVKNWQHALDGVMMIAQHSPR